MNALKLLPSVRSTHRRATFWLIARIAADTLCGPAGGSRRRALRLEPAMPDVLTLIIDRPGPRLSARGMLDDLKSPPGNRLEALKDNLAGYHRSRVNDLWRIIFGWQGSNAFEGQIIDYH